MRVFWAMMAVLVLATGGLMAMRGRGAEAPTTLTSRTPPAAEHTESRGIPEVDLPEEEPAKTDGGPIDEEPVEPAPIRESPGGDPGNPGETIEVEVGVADETELRVEPEGDPAPLAEDKAVADGSGEEGAVEETDGEEEAFTLLLNERHKITGAGTAADPYEIDFDLLVALEQDYEPKIEGKKEIPEWIMPLDGKHVVVTGFIGFPFIAPSSDECMVMLNQWDGCCIGVPPTPYDAIEVQLAEPVDLSAGVPNYGTVRGVFRTDPYLVNGWLIGLYVMDEARLEKAGSKNQAGF